MKTFAEIAVAMGKTDDYLGDILVFIENSVNEGNNDLLINSLDILKQAFKHTSKERVSIVAQQESQRLSKFLNTAMCHNQSKVVSETLKVIGMFVIQLQDPFEGTFLVQQTAIVKELYRNILEKLHL